MTARTSKAQQHRWPTRIVIDDHETHRPCSRCGILQVTRHEAGERPWKEFHRDGVIVARAGQPTPACDARIEKAKALSEQTATHPAGSRNNPEVCNMKSQATLKSDTEAAPTLEKADAASPAFVLTGPSSVSVKAGTTFAGRVFAEETAIEAPTDGYEAGSDYVVFIDDDGAPLAVKLAELPSHPHYLGGYHFAPGGNAPARAGGDDLPQINPYSLWDRNFRPACADPRGMALVDGKFWADIYLLGVNHLTDGTSKFGVTIADGNDRPINPSTKKPFKSLDYDTALAVMFHHGKQLLSIEERFAFAFGVTEKTSCQSDPRVTGLDAARTSRWGGMQASGNMWEWGHDGDPDEPRAAIFGGSWWDAGDAGSRRAHLDFWAGDSGGYLGARGRSDHLILA